MLRYFKRIIMAKNHVSSKFSRSLNLKSKIWHKYISRRIKIKGNALLLLVGRHIFETCNQMPTKCRCRTWISWHYQLQQYQSHSKQAKSSAFLSFHTHSSQDFHQYDPQFGIHLLGNDISLSHPHTQINWLLLVDLYLP